MHDAVIIQLVEGPKYREMALLTIDTISEYCRVHKCDYLFHSAPVRYWDKKPLTSWAKLALAQQAILQGYRYVFTLDADLFISNPQVDFREAAVKPVNMVRWWKGRPVNHLNAGVIFWNNKGDEAYRILSGILQEAKYYLERMPGIRGWYEQGHLNELAAQPLTKNFFGEMPLAYNWSQDYCPPCSEPIITSYHGVKPIEAVIARMKRDIPTSKRVASDAVWVLLELVQSTVEKSRFDLAAKNALKFLVDEKVLEEDENGEYSMNPFVEKVLSQYRVESLPFTEKDGASLSEAP